MGALDDFLRNFKQFADVITDSYFVVDAERNIVDFNRAFFAMLPRTVARGLSGKKCYDVVEHSICKSACIAQQCWQSGRHVRLDEISSRVAQGTGTMRFILSSMPILDANGQAVGAIEVQRNVTDEAAVQSKYQQMLESEARERERLAREVRARTQELLDANQVLLRTQRELSAYKKGIMG
jgi:PAS domain-containing protein